MTDRRVDDPTKSRDNPRKPDTTADARQRARDRAGEEGLPRKSGPPKRGPA